MIKMSIHQKEIIISMCVHIEPKILHKAWTKKKKRNIDNSTIELEELNSSLFNNE